MTTSAQRAAAVKAMIFLLWFKKTGNEFPIVVVKAKVKEVSHSITDYRMVIAYFSGLQTGQPLPVSSSELKEPNFHEGHIFHKLNFFLVTISLKTIVLSRNITFF